MGVAGERGAWSLAVFDPVTSGRFRFGSISVVRSVPDGEGSGLLIFPRFVVVVQAQLLWGGVRVVHKVRQPASQVPLRFGTLLRDGVGRVVAVRSGRSL